jgi:succinyl-CoA synthetase beta subunit
VRAGLAAARREGRTALTEAEAAALLAAYGIPVCPSRRAGSLADLDAALAALAPPWVLKVLSPEVPHKSDVGGVETGLRTGAAAREAFERILRRAGQAAPAARLEGVLVQSQVEGAVAELLLGAFLDEQFGPVIVAGLGGVFAEALDDVAIRVAPVERAEARRMLAELRGRRILRGFRGRPAADVEAVAEAISRLSRLAVELEAEVAEVDVNPLLVLPAGRGALAVDALVRLRGPDALPRGG